MTAIDVEKFAKEMEWTRRREIVEGILSFSFGKSFEFEERDITRACVGHVGNGFAHEEPTGDKEFVIRVRAGQ